MQELFQAFPDLLDRFKGNDMVLAAFVLAAWRKSAGELLRQRTEPLAFEHKRLTLAVENAIWKRHLEDLSGDMLYRLNAALGQGVVSYIEFRVDENAVVTAADRTRTGTTNDNTPTIPSPALKNAALRISDPQLRERFLEAAGIYLTRRDG